MSHLLFWPTTIFFYPIGNTSAVCLTENLPPESEADVLLLACGDPRHILYTVYADEGNPLSRSRKLDITCCDVDAAILARNTLLFTLLADEGALNKLDSLWDLFYHIFVDRSALSMLYDQCRKLVNLSESVTTWRAGPYGQFITTCDSATLAELRRVWAAFLDTSTSSAKQAKRFEQRFTDGLKQVLDRTVRKTATAARSAGPLVLHAVEAVSRQYESYWSSGTTDDGRTSGQTRRLSVNPTFAISMDGDTFSVHYGTDPLSGFHLAEAFASGKFIRLHEGIPPNELVRVAKDQFRRWCTSVHGRLRDGHTLVIRLFAGDALAFSQALKYCNVMRSPVTPYNVAAWRLSTITLDEHYYGRDAPSPAPLSFNVIDTSNILDHVGLVNVLVVTAPLLRKTASATLYTEALRKRGEDPSQAVLEHVCGDLPTMALLLGVVPSTLISQITTRSNVHETMLKQGSKQYYERMAWKVIASEVEDDDVAPVRLCFSPPCLAAFLFSVYLAMFSEESIWTRFPFLSRSPEHMIRELERSGVLHYNRRSFALFVHYVKTRLPTMNWSFVMDAFEDLVLSDRQLFIGRHAYQELCCQLHLLGVYTTEWMSPALALGDGADAGPFRDWRHLPQVVTLVLVVPRSAVTELEPEFKDVGTPVLHCDLQDGPRQLWFAVTSATFGTLCVSGTGENRTGVVLESEQPPWRSKAPLIISFSIPTSSVMDFGKNVRATVGLALRSTMAVAPKFMSKLGHDLTVFRTELANAERVFLLARRPVVGSSSTEAVAGHWREDVIVSPEQASSSASESPSTDVHVDFSKESPTIQAFTVHIDVTEPAARAALANTRTIPTVSSGSASTRCSDARVRIGAHTYAVRFPLPVDIACVRLRVARRSSYIEVIAPPISFQVRPECDLSDRFGSSPNGPALGSIHRVNLDRCPAFSLSTAAQSLNWYDVHLGETYSALERRRTMHRLELTQQMRLHGRVPLFAFPHAFDALLDVKQTVQFILGTAAGTDGPPNDAFALVDISRGVPYLYVVVARTCLDLGSHTVVADAFVAPATPAVRTALRESMSTSTSTGRIAHIDTDPEEAASWFQLLPRLTERCRTWPHATTCAYRATYPPHAPSDTWKRSPLCACGEGVGTEVLPRRFERVARYMTRAALSPLFPVAYLQEADVPASGCAAEPQPQPQPEPEPEKGMGMGMGTGKAGAKHTCGSCGKEGGLTCGRCKRARYCSKACQRAGWKTHKKVCRPA